MMTIHPTRRPFFTSLRGALTVLLLAAGSSALLLLSGIDAKALACVVWVQ